MLRAVNRRSARLFSLTFMVTACSPAPTVVEPARTEPTALQPSTPDDEATPSGIDEPEGPPPSLGAATKCTRHFGTPIDDDVIRRQPATSDVGPDAVDRAVAPGTRLLLRGFPVFWHECPPCPEGASCKPCEAFVVLASTPHSGIEQPITPSLDLWLMMSDPKRLERGKQYRVVVDVCDGRSAVSDGPHLEWRGSVVVAAR